VREVRNDSIFWGNIWRQCGRPKDGIVADLMRKNKREYHYAVRDVKRRESELRKVRMSESVIANKGRDFWTELRKMNPKARKITPRIGAAVGDQNIVRLLQDKYQRLYNSVPTEASHMLNVKAEIDEALGDDCLLSCIVSSEEVAKAVAKLKPCKSDGSHGLWSSHIILAGNVILPYLSDLVTAMLIHGHCAKDLLTATLISLPKNNKASLSDENNYRGISLASCISKIVDLIIIDRYPEELRTSDLQFAFKDGNSTSMCTYLVKEIANYYNNRGSDVFMCLLDATKAFDRIHFGTLFEILSKRKFPPSVLRLIVDMYENQLLRTSWNGHMSHYFKCSNGVKQGGILSPILFSIYMDELLLELQQDGTGCWVGSEYVGVAAYADDLVLMSPSRQGLQRMINICEQFSLKTHVSFNPLKSVCIRMSNSDRGFQVTLNGEIIKCATSVKHLGQIINHDLKERLETEYKRSDLVRRYNYIMGTYKSVTSNVKYRLFDSYCLHLYGTASWILEDSSIRTFITAWNICIRKMWGLCRNTHRNLLPEICQCDPVEYQIWNRFAGLFKACKNRKNRLMNSVTDIFLEDQRSIVCRNIYSIATKCGVDVADIRQAETLKIPKHKPNDQVAAEAAVVRDCVLTLQSVYNIEQFSRDELAMIRDYLSIY
jgi:hypothetical protein